MHVLSHLANLQYLVALSFEYYLLMYRYYLIFVLSVILSRNNTSHASQVLNAQNILYSLLSKNIFIVCFLGLQFIFFIAILVIIVNNICTLGNVDACV